MPFAACLQNRVSRWRGIFPECDRQYSSTGFSLASSQGRFITTESLFRDSPKDREFGAMTVAMTEDEFNKVRFELRQLRKRLQKDILVGRKSTKGDRVYQLNVQLFPVTEKT